MGDVVVSELQTQPRFQEGFSQQHHVGLVSSTETRGSLHRELSCASLQPNFRGTWSSEFVYKRSLRWMFQDFSGGDNKASLKDFLLAVTVLHMSLVLLADSVFDAGASCFGDSAFATRLVPFVIKHFHHGALDLRLRLCPWNRFHSHLRVCGRSY